MPDFERSNPQGDPGPDNTPVLRGDSSARQKEETAGAGDGPVVRELRTIERSERKAVDVASVATALLTVITMLQLWLAFSQYRRDYLDKRSWVMFNVQTCRFELGKVPACDSQLVNSGHSVAQHVLSYERLETGPDLKFSPGDTEPSQAGVPMNGGAVIAPGYSYPLLLPWQGVLTADQLHATETQNVFIYGTVVYGDFGSGQHRTRFCFVKRPVDERFRQCLETPYNSAD
jgi:hypothetical protein